MNRCPRLVSENAPCLFPVAICLCASFRQSVHKKNKAVTSRLWPSAWLTPYHPVWLIVSCQVATIHNGFPHTYKPSCHSTTWGYCHLAVFSQHRFITDDTVRQQEPLSDFHATHSWWKNLTGQKQQKNTRQVLRNFKKQATVHE